MDLALASRAYDLQTRPTLPPRTDGIRFYPVRQLPKPVASRPLALHGMLGAATRTRRQRHATPLRIVGSRRRTSPTLRHWQEGLRRLAARSQRRLHPDAHGAQRSPRAACGATSEG